MPVFFGNIYNNIGTTENPIYRSSSASSSSSTSKQIYNITATRRSHIADGEAPSNFLNSNWWGIKIIDFNDGLGDIRDVRLEVHLSGTDPAPTDNAKIDGLFRRYNENLISIGKASDEIDNVRVRAGMLAKYGSSSSLWTTDGGQYKSINGSIEYSYHVPSFEGSIATLYYHNNVVSLWFEGSFSPSNTLMRMSGSIEILTPNITD